ncbi:MAG TPA: acyl carrier protein [Caulobacteraceae bacterium]
MSLVDSAVSVAVRPIRDDIAVVLEQVLGRPVQITDDTDIIADLGMDSLGVMNFVMAIEDFYDISIPLDRIAQVETVGDLIHAVEHLRAGALG